MKSILVIPVTLLLLLGIFLSVTDARTIKVGVYENEPMVFVDEEGRPQGFYIVLLEHIAAAEGWDISYVFGKRWESISRLAEGEIDVLPGIGLEPEDSEYKLTRVSVLSDWGQVYSGVSSGIETIGNLSEKTIAVARGDRMYSEFRATTEELGIECHFVEVDGYGDAARMVGEGVVDACLVPRLYSGGGVTGDLGRSAFPGPPVALRIAVGKSAGTGLSEAIDRHIAELREQPGSAYYKAQNSWFGGLSVGGRPGWDDLLHILGVSVIAALILAGILHRIQMKSRTRDLQEEINDRKRAEEALRKSEERFHTLYNKMNEGVCLHEMIFDEAGHAVDYIVLDVNPSYESILGRQRDEVIGRRGSELFDTEEPPFMTAYADVAATERHMTFDSYFQPARRHFRISAFSPQPGKVAAILSDVTESKERMDELKTSEGKYRILFENAPDPMYLNDLSGVLVEGNKAAEQLLGYKTQELVGANMLKVGLIPIEETLKAANNISLCAQGKPTGPDEFTLIRKDGSQVKTEISTRPVKVDGQTLALGIIRDVSERKQAEVSLRESEDRLRAVYESMGNALLISDLNGNIQQVNRSALNMLGYVSKEELLGSHSYLCVAETDRQRASEDMMRALKMNERIVDEYELLKKGGGTIACAVDVDLLRDRDGNAVGFVILLHDITERRHRDQILQEDVNKYRSLLEGLEEAVFRVGLPIGKYDYVSPSVKRVFGYTSEEFLKNPLLMRKLVHEDYARYFNDMWKDLIQGHIQPSYEYKIVDREGRGKWVLQTNRRVFNEAGKVLAIEGIWRDITEQKQVDDSIRENEEQFRAMFAGSSTALEFYDADRRLVLANNACLDLFGVGDLKDLRKLNLLTDESTPEEARAGLRGGGPARWTTTLDFAALRENGRIESRRSDRIRVDIIVSRVDVGDGSPGWYLAGIHNVGEYRTMESPARATGGLEPVARLSRAMAQDFNNILTAIMGYSEHLASELGDNESLHNEVEEIRKAAETAVTRTRQLLTFSKSAPVKSRLLDLNTVVSEMEGRIKRTLGEDKSLEVKLGPDIGEIRVDREQLETVIMNLVSNARDVMRSGQTLSIETNSIEIDDVSDEYPEGSRPGHFANIAVTDQGTGMEEDVLRHIFEPFFTTRDGHAGMGLSVVYGSVRQHGGWVDVYSEAGKGTEFKVYFPARAACQEENGRGTAGIGRLQGGGERILLVEDDEIVRSMAAKVLREKGYNVLAAADGEEAREIFERENREFDLIFCDIVLPDANGLDLAGEMYSANPAIRVLLTSGFADRQTQLANLGDKNYPLLEKPYALFDLLTAIKETLAQPAATPGGVRS